MEYVSFFKQLFTIAFGGFAALVLTFYIIWPKIENYLLKINNLNQSKALTKEALQAKFAAYERLILFAHRISPQQLLSRHYTTQLSIDDFKKIIIADVESEFQHNFTQQLYVSDASWTAIQVLKENTLTLIRNSRKGLGPSATLDDYIGTTLKHVSELDVNPYDAAQLLLKKDLTLYAGE